MVQPNALVLFSRRFTSWIRSPYAVRVLALVACLESAFLPIPVETVFIPMCIATPTLAYRYVLIVIAASLTGTIYGYSLGYFGTVFIEALPSDSMLDYQFESTKLMLEKSSLPSIVLAGLSPVPIPTLAITAGSSSVGALPYISLFMAGQTVRLVIAASLISLWQYGKRYRRQ